MKKKLFLFLIVITLISISVVKVNFTKVSAGSLLYANIEALAGGGEDLESKCRMIKDECYIERVTEHQLEALRYQFGGFNGFVVGDRVDLSNYTRLYVLPNGGSVVRCGKDIRCGDIMSSL